MSACPPMHGLQLRPHGRLLFVQDITVNVSATACPIQITAHHHIDVYVDINY